MTDARQAEFDQEYAEAGAVLYEAAGEFRAAFEADMETGSRRVPRAVVALVLAAEEWNSARQLAHESAEYVKPEDAEDG